MIEKLLMKMKKNDTFETIEILENAIITFSNRSKKLFNAILIDENIVVFGRILNQEKFITDEGIPKNNIIHIEGGKNIKLIKKKERFY